MSVLPPGWDQLFAENHLALKTNVINFGQDYSRQVWGQTIPLSQGERAIVGAPLWAADTVATTTYSDAQILSFFGGGDSGSGHELITTISYRRSFAVAFGYNLAPLGEHTDPRLQRLWINDVLVYDSRLPGITSQNFGLVDFTFYPGREDQVPDATMVAKDGALTPAYRGMIYVVIRDLNLGSHSTPPGVGIWSAAQDSAFWDFSQTVALPRVRAEIVDGLVTTIGANQYLLSDTVNLPFGSGHSLPNYQTRKWIVMGQSSGAPNYSNYLMTFDIDGLVENTSIKVTGTVNGNPIDSSITNGIYGQSYFNAWDTKNDVYYGELGTLTNNNTIVSVDRKTGVVKGWCGTQGTFGPIDHLGGDPTVSHLDCVQFPFWHDGDVSWYRNGDGINKPIIAGAEQFNGWMTIIAPRADGSMDPTVPFDAIHQFSSFHSLGFYPIADLMAGNGVQDPIAICCNGTKATAVFIHVDSSYRAHIVQIQDIFDFTPKQCLSFAIDGQGAINFILSDGGLNFFTSRFQTKVTSSSNQFWASGSGAVAGYSGAVPVWTKVYDPVSIPNIGGDLQQFRRTDWTKASTGAYINAGNIDVLNLQNGQAVIHSQGINLSGKFWDPVGQQAVGQTFSGAAYNIPIADSSNFVADKIGDYVKWLSVLVGYPEVNITIDPLLNDDVLGALVVQPFVHSDLMNKLGELYNFTYFESSGNLKFLKLARNPVKATDELAYNVGNVNDGDTVTIGAQVYTYRNAPTLPFEVKVGATVVASRDNLVKAINLTGTPGTEYAAGTTINVSVVASADGSDKLLATAIHGGAAGNSIVVNRSGTSMNWTPNGSHLVNGADSLAAELSLTRDNMCAVAEGGADINEVLITTLNEPSAGIGSVVMTYWDFDQDYAANTATATADTTIDTVTTNVGEEQIGIPFVMTEAEANSRVQKLVLQGAQKSITQEMRLPPQFLLTEPVDVCSITIPPYQYLVKLDEVTINADWTLSCSGLNFASRDDIAIPPMVDRQVDVTMKTTGDGVPVVFDMPFPTPYTSDITGKFGLFDGVASYGQPGFTVAAVSTIDDLDNADLVFTATQPIPSGSIVTVLQDTNHPWQVDETPIVVTCKSMTTADFASASSANFLAGKNALVVGAAGRWELIYFRDVAVLNSSTVQLTGIIRGMRGTEVNCGLHAAGDAAYLVASVATGFTVTGFQEYRDISEVGSTLTYTSQGAPAAKPIGTLDVTFKGYSWYPFAPVCVHATKSGADVVLTWARRDRHATNLWVEEDEAMTEASEQYKVEILSGSSVVRTVTGLTSPTFTYTAAMQTTDGFTPTITSIKLRVYQVGATLGAGFTREQTLDVE